MARKRTDSDFILGIRFINEVDKIESKSPVLSKKQQKKFISRDTDTKCKGVDHEYETNKYNPF